MIVMSAFAGKLTRLGEDEWLIVRQTVGLRKI